MPARNRIIAATNIAIAVVALLLVVVCIKKFFLAGAKPRPLPAIQVGTKISVPNVDWSRSRETMLVVLQDGCRFCTESSPFYRRLVEQSSRNAGVRLIAVLPQDPDRGRRYLDSLGVTIAEVKQSDLGAIGVAGTPTLLLLDNQGKVEASWVGTLSAPQEAEVLRRVGTNESD
jgi:hypothetical protein